MMEDVVDDLGRKWDLSQLAPAMVAFLAKRSAERAVDHEAMEK